MPTPIISLGNYRDKLTPGTVLGLAYKVDDPAYLVTRVLPIQQFTVQQVDGKDAIFRKADGHELRLSLNQELTFLRFGAFLPYHQHENILPVSDSDDYDAFSEPGKTLRGDVTAAVSRVLDQHAQVIDKYVPRPKVLALWVFKGVIDALGNHRRPSPSS